jgi:superfamily II DNA/RNA helicase
MHCDRQEQHGKLQFVVFFGSNMIDQSFYNMIIFMTDFASSGVIPSFCSTLESMGYTSPSPIQAQAIPHILAGTDIF